MEGYSYDHYVVYKITHNDRFGYHSFNQSSDIGYTPIRDNKADKETDELLTKTQAKRTDEIEQIKAEEKRSYEGHEWLEKNLPIFEETAYLADYNEDYEHREKYSMGKGYYLGENYYQDWIIKNALSKNSPM